MLLEIGAALSVAGTLMGNFSQAQAEKDNAKFNMRQAMFNRLAGFRQEEITRRNYSYLKGQQASVAAASGAMLTGSVAGILAETAVQEMEEIEAIRMQTKMDVDLALIRSRQSSANADMLQNPFYNAAQVSTTLINSGVFGG